MLLFARWRCRGRASSGRRGRGAFQFIEGGAAGFHRYREQGRRRRRTLRHDAGSDLTEDEHQSPERRSRRRGLGLAQRIPLKRVWSLAASALRASRRRAGSRRGSRVMHGVYVAEQLCAMLGGLAKASGRHGRCVLGWCPEMTAHRHGQDDRRVGSGERLTALPSSSNDPAGSTNHGLDFLRRKPGARQPLRRYGARQPRQSHSTLPRASLQGLPSCGCRTPGRWQIRHSLGTG